jgi:hypothetical protein
MSCSGTALLFTFTLLKYHALRHSQLCSSKRWCKGSFPHVSMSSKHFGSAITAKKYPNKLSANPSLRIIFIIVYTTVLISEFCSFAASKNKLLSSVECSSFMCKLISTAVFLLISGGFRPWNLLSDPFWVWTWPDVSVFHVQYERQCLHTRD